MGMKLVIISELYRLFAFSWFVGLELFRTIFDRLIAALQHQPCAVTEAICLRGIATFSELRLHCSREKRAFAL